MAVMSEIFVLESLKWPVDNAEMLYALIFQPVILREFSDYRDRERKEGYDCYHDERGGGKLVDLVYDAVLERSQVFTSYLNHSQVIINKTENNTRFAARTVTMCRGIEIGIWRARPLAELPDMCETALYLLEFMKGVMNGRHGEKRRVQMRMAAEKQRLELHLFDTASQEDGADEMDYDFESEDDEVIARQSEGEWRIRNPSTGELMSLDD